MKRIITLLFVFFNCVGALFAAEPLIIDKLILKHNDLSASVYSVTDNNGKPCGLLKVITNDKSMSFEGSIVGTPEYNKGEYWVYISPGTYQIRIKSSAYAPLMLNFRDYNLQEVQSKTTYELSFHYQSYDVMDLKPNSYGYYRIIQGPKLKKYAVSILTLPYGLNINGISSLDYLKKLAKLLSQEGDGWGDKYECTIVAHIDSPGDQYEINSYQLIIESCDDEGDAIWSVAAGHGGFEEVIYIVKK